jgi:hypothetical protein
VRAAWLLAAALLLPAGVALGEEDEVEVEVEGEDEVEDEGEDEVEDEGEPAPIPMPGEPAPIPMPGEGGGASQLAWRPTWTLRGYVEDTFAVEVKGPAKKPKEALLNITRARVNLEGKPTRWMDFGVGVVGQLYAGKTTYAVAPYLPEHVQDDLFAGMPELGLPGTEALLEVPLENRVWLQEAFGTLYGPWFELRIGRQKVYSGTGFAWNPIDLLNAKDVLDPTYEVEGLDGIRAIIELPAQFEIEGFVRFSDRFHTQDYVAKVRTSVGGWDFGVQYTHYVHDRIEWEEIDSAEGVAALAIGAPMEDFERSYRWHLVAGEVAGELGPIGIHAEGGYVFVDPRGAAEDGGRPARSHERFLVGLDTTLPFGLYLVAEYMRLGNGRSRTSTITLSDRMGLLAGEIPAIGRDSLFVGASMPIADLIDVELYAIVALNDPSAVLNPWLTVHVRSGVRLSVMAAIPVGTKDGVNGRSPLAIMGRLKFSF